MVPESYTQKEQIKLCPLTDLQESIETLQETVNLLDDIEPNLPCSDYPATQEGMERLTALKKVITLKKESYRKAVKDGQNKIQ